MIDGILATSIESTMAKAIATAGLANLLEQAVRLIHGANHAQGLYPAQWVALRYFRDALPRSRTIAHLARFQGINLNVVARTVRTLVERGLLEREPNPRDKRSALVYLTPAGRTTLKQDPQAALAGVLDKLALEDRTALADILQTIVQEMMLVATGEAAEIEAERVKAEQEAVEEG
jgi:DNA-binding MarR family transcriptional regulator